MTLLPKEGTPWPELKAQLQEAGQRDVDWRGGRVPMFIHYAGEDVLEVAKQAYLMYFSENGLGLRAFGSLARFESEVVAMALGLLHGSPSARGAMTTGGTESIFLAVKAARDQARQRNPAMGTAQIVMAASAHPAFDKAAHFMGLTPIRTPLRADFTADPQAIAAAITPDTVMVVGSVPAFPHGVVDPIGEIAAVASAQGVWMHVDACVGGYFAPFAQQLGVQLPDWDFAVPGVVSISADLHKYGYTAKGASTLFFRDAESFAGMGWYFDGWPRGQYFTNTLVGTRAGGAIAAAWAVMNYLGEAGYRRIAERVLATRRALQDGAAELGLSTFGTPQLSILAYGSPAHDIAAIGAGLTKRGWVAGYVTEPSGLHHMLNLTHEPVVGRYLDDLAAAIREAPAPQGQAVGPLAQY
ncbi:pyridoxal phosphate-dependent decarboxylase family protein [Variovorax guangxiensis]|uniref:Aspartate aminotransferase family protein n=1 Tax=Variovorax guangxiensis TaxID=1775474 RepID=A0A502DZU0_9BURK|nr:aminotransferase class V-fold PLP-dependent enzyme [Variovorax guangxiensis]RZI65733.1 MAG: aspartate aminotransferase family protein [Variovorax sp.]TPG26454.1 aspartate aminotransferase family protein [Variovorax ginsengisoli]TPG30179.1 aspartate aminotransferase family protein [Variovorax guangxiensis]